MGCSLSGLGLGGFLQRASWGLRARTSSGTGRAAESGTGQAGRDDQALRPGRAPGRRSDGEHRDEHRAGDHLRVVALGGPSMMKRPRPPSATYAAIVAVAITCSTPSAAPEMISGSAYGQLDAREHLRARACPCPGRVARGRVDVLRPRRRCRTGSAGRRGCTSTISGGHDVRRSRPAGRRLSQQPRPGTSRPRVGRARAAPARLTTTKPARPVCPIQSPSGIAISAAISSASKRRSRGARGCGPGCRRSPSSGPGR